MMSDLRIEDGLVIVSTVTNKGDLGKYLAKVRIDLNITQSQMANLIEINPSQLSSIEKRKRAISRKAVDKFIKEFGLDGFETYDFRKLVIMHNVACKAELAIREMVE